MQVQQLAKASAEQLAGLASAQTSAHRLAAENSQLQHCLADVESQAAKLKADSAQLQQVKRQTATASEVRVAVPAG